MNLPSININIKSSTFEKLIDVTSKAIGSLCAPALLRRFAEARGKEIIAIGTSVKELKECLGPDAEINYQNDTLRVQLNAKKPLQPNVDFYNRIEDRLATLEANRQRNLDKVTIFAMKNLNYEKEPDGTSVDQDWSNNFFNAAQDISDDKMQEVWGKILAAEVEKPGSFSSRSLNVLQGLTRSEAELFQDILKFKVFADNEANIIGNDISKIKPDGKRWPNLLLMRELGLVKESIFITTYGCDYETSFSHYGLSFRVKIKKGHEFKLYGCPLTRVGQELASLIKHEPNDDFFELVAQEISNQKCDLTVIEHVCR